MLWRVILLEKDKIFKRAIFWIELAILSLLIVLVNLAEFIFSRFLPPEKAKVVETLFTWPNGLASATQFAGSGSLGGLLLIILVGAITAREYSWRTFHLWLSRGVPRFVLLEAKYIMALLSVFVIVFTSLIVSGLMTGIFTIIIYGSLHTDQVDVGRLIITILITGYSVLPYVALTFMLTLLSRSAILSISGVLAFIFVIEGSLYTGLTFAGGTAAQLVQYLPIGLEEALYTSGQNSGSQSSLLHISSPPAVVAVIGIALYVLIFLGIGTWKFLHQNFTD